MNTHKDAEYKRRGSASMNLISSPFFEQQLIPKKYTVFVIGSTLRSPYIRGRHKVGPDVPSETWIYKYFITLYTGFIFQTVDFSNISSWSWCFINFFLVLCLYFKHSLRVECRTYRAPWCTLSVCLPTGVHRNSLEQELICELTNDVLCTIAGKWKGC